MIKVLLYACLVPTAIYCVVNPECVEGLESLGRSVGWCLAVIMTAAMFDRSNRYLSNPLVHHAICSVLAYCLAGTLYAKEMLISASILFVVRVIFDSKRIKREVEDNGESI